MSPTPTPPWRPLFDAYVRASGIAVSPSMPRIDACAEIAARGFTAEDVVAVLKRIQGHLSKGTLGYTDASLDFRNAMLKVDLFEERALKLRQEKARRPVAKKLVPVSRPLPDGRTETVQAPELEREVPAVDVSAALRKMADELVRKGA